MQFKILNALAVASLAAANTCTLIDGMYYCNEVKQVQYTGVGFSGTYNKITGMDSNSGSCSSEQVSFSGALSPIDEELSLHFRGPLHLYKFAAYTPGSGSKSKREVKRRHHVHKREPAIVTQVEAATYYVTVDQNGNLITATGHKTESVSAVSVLDNSAAASSPAGESGSVSSLKVNNYNFNGLANPSTTGPSVITESSAAPTSTASIDASGDWTRNAYYDSAAGTSNGLVFLNNKGGAGSGVFDYSFGNSLSYAGADGSSCASSPETLSDVTLDSNDEVIIFTDNKCSGDDCGFTRDGIPAYHGFDGSKKIFLFEFSMPFANGDTSIYNYDMPAIWSLNAQIPRTLQYGNALCSCWTTGCGELDLFEILSAGNTKCTTTLHTKQGGAGKGSPDYFARPTGDAIKAAVIFDGQSVTITTLDDSVDFSASLDEDTINGWISSTSGSGSVVAL